jgi:hypothetical protein
MVANPPDKGILLWPTCPSEPGYFAAVKPNDPRLAPPDEVEIFKAAGNNTGWN